MEKGREELTFAFQYKVPVCMRKGYSGSDKDERRNRWGGRKVRY